jgi:hypothetical protein
MAVLCSCFLYLEVPLGGREKISLGLLVAAPFSRSRTPRNPVAWFSAAN